MPVVCCSLHSQLAPVRAGLGRGPRVAYVQLGGGALPVSLSDTVRTLKRAGLLEVAVAASPCTDGDVQAVTPASALAWCAAQGFDVVICSIGPGIVGTGTLLGHGGIAAAVAANTATASGGTADTRRAHVGGGQAGTPPRRLAPRPCDPRPLPRRGDDRVAARTRRAGLAGAARAGRRGGMARGLRRLPMAHMGRRLEDDPCFFMCAFAAGEVARDKLAA